MKKFSKTLSLFLSLALLLTVFSTTAIAGDLSSEEFSGELVGVDLGGYQDNLTWTVEGDTLYIRGEGDMKTYDLFGAPWKLHKDSVKHAIIGNGVTSISSYAFYEMSSLESISISETVESIGDHAFYSCSSLKFIKLPFAVTKIDSETFFYCFSLENIEMSNYVTSIGERAFYFCEKLSSITIPLSVTNIADNAFEGCTALSTIKGDAGSVSEEYAKSKGLTFVARTPEEAAIGSGPVDLGDEFYANINIPALDKTFTNNGEGNVVAEAANGSDAQVWHFLKSGIENEYVIESKLDGRYLTVADTSDSLSNVFVSYDAQQYNVYSVNGKYIIAPVGIEDKVVDVNGVDFNVQYWTFSVSNTCQQYDIVKIGENDDTSDETSDDVTSDDVTSDDVTSDDVTSDDVTSDDVTSDDVTSDDVTSDDITSDDVTSDDVTSDVVTSDDVTSDDVTSDDITSDDSVNQENEYYMDDDTSTMPNVVENTLASDMISVLEQYNVTATITDKNGNVLGSDAKVGTGSIVKTSDGKEFTVIVKGDVDGTGVVNATDYLTVKKAFSKDIELSGVFYSAADTDGNKTINATDYIKIKSYFLKDASLYA